MRTVPPWLETLTFQVEHNPNCPSPYRVRLVYEGRIYGDGRDAVGHGRTLDEAAQRAKLQLDARKAIRACQLAGVDIPGEPVK